MEISAFKARVEGIVQGVGFRFFTEDKAREYDLKGYVKNMYDGSVEVYAEGKKNILEKFLNDIKTGPRMSRVENTEVHWKEAENQYDSFIIKY